MSYKDKINNKGVFKMAIKESRIKFEHEKKVYEKSILKFHGIEGYDAYNCSIPFFWKGKKYIFARVENRNEWARSQVRLFEEIGIDEWCLVTDSMFYQMEDPYVSIINEELVLGGTHVRYQLGKVDTYYGYFYRGRDLNNLYYYTTGPERMKDIRIVELEDGKIGVFSRPRGKEILSKYGSESMVGFVIIDNLDKLSAEVINTAPYIDNLFDKGEWGGCNQAYLLDSGLIGCIGHTAYNEKDENGIDLKVYLNTAFVFNPKTHELLENKIIASRSSYPVGVAKKPHLIDCTFPSGIVMRSDGKVDLYAGLGDCEEGRIVIDYPFEGYGKIVS